METLIGSNLIDESGRFSLLDTAQQDDGATIDQMAFKNRSLGQTSDPQHAAVRGRKAADNVSEKATTS